MSEATQRDGFAVRILSDDPKDPFRDVDGEDLLELLRERLYDDLEYSVTLEIQRAI